MLDVCGSRCGAKINGSYYRDELLSKQLLPAIRSTALFYLPTGQRTVLVIWWLFWLMKHHI